MGPSMQILPLAILNWLLAFAPIAVVLILMVGFGWGGSKAGPVGWIVALAIAWLRFGAGLDVLFYSQIRGILLSFYVLYIIWMALFLYRVVDEAGAITVIGQGITRLTSVKVMQLLLLAWAFSAFLQGVAGFGVPIAVVAPLLIGLGFTPVVAVASVAIGHSWSVTFGDIASSFQALMAATGLPGEILAPWASLFLGVTCFGCGIAAVWTFGRWESVRTHWLALLLMGLVMASVQAALAMSGLWSLAGFGAGLAGLAVGALLTRMPRYRASREQTPPSAQVQDAANRAATEAQGPRQTISLWQALAPYLLLIIVVTAAELWPWLHRVLNQIKIQLSFPEVQTTYGWITPAGPGRSISVFGHAGALLAFTSLVAYSYYVLSGLYTPGVGRRVVQRTVKSAVPASIGIVSMVGMAVAMDNSGMTYVLASGISKAAGPLYPLMAPYIGLLGAFMTGSNTNSNVVFAPLQQQAAQLLAISVPVILAAQTAGGALGSMLAPAKVIVGCSTAGLAGKEGDVLKKTLPPGLLIAGVVGILTWVVLWLGGT